ncbi:hypothetical protein CAPTEDRAFT_213064 [Capitella teleta]|uniref:RNA helicase n=1 Tax=Capitella teleta TaxID=283909 RepID=R7UZ41_CAPTE|nr:hypothetical protein CAPTEDRAFT_213064 [Capitella teleta]|eukprot:ELU09217.1 hypothetical protein CAPTEDRAFT_213064 [Capitella teleta]
MTHVLGIVDPNVQAIGRSMIVCCDTAETVEVYKLLRSQSLYALYAHADLPVAQVQATNVEWNLTHARNSAPVLVCSDEILDSMDVSNVEVIVHFSVAKNSSLFGARLWCARRKFLHPFLAEHPIKQGVVSHLLLSENDSSHASSLVRLLERCDVEIPRKLLAMRDRDLLQKEGSKQAQLCPHFKAFGRCSRQKWCRMRHCFYEALDGAQVPMETVRPPAEGEVKFFQFPVYVIF